MSTRVRWWGSQANPRELLSTLLAAGFVLALSLPVASQTAVVPRSAASEPETTSETGVAETHAQQITAAEALYQEARILMDQGQYEKACPLLQESNRHDFALGTLLYLAQCYEEIGRTAAAWSAFELAASESRKSKQEQRERIARQRADALKPKLMRLRISVPQEHRIEGLVITRNGGEVREPVYEVAIPVDPGLQRIEASAPKHESWAKEVELTEPGKTVTVLVPHLVPVAKRQAPREEPKATEPLLGAPAASLGDHARTSGPVPWSTVGLAVAGAGIVSAGLGTYLAVHSQSVEEDGREHCEKQEVLVCNETGMNLLDDADRELLWGQIALGAGGAAILGGVGLYLWAPDRASQSAHRVIPEVGTRSAALFWRGVF